MAKLTIELDSETHQNLKKLAIKDERSLTQYIQRVLRYHAGTLRTLTTTDTTTDTITSMLNSHEEPAINKESDSIWN